MERGCSKGNDMKEEETKLESLIKRMEFYINSTLELFKLKAAKAISEMMASLLLWTLVSLIFLLMLLILSIGVSFWLGQIYGNWLLGFVLVAAFYFLVAVVIAFLFPSSIRRGLANTLLKIMFRK